MVNLSIKLRELRQERQWTQNYVAKKLGVSASVVSAYELSIRQPSYESLVRLAYMYNVSTDYLLGLSSLRTPKSHHTISLDGLTPDKISLVIKLVDALKD